MTENKTGGEQDDAGAIDQALNEDASQVAASAADEAGASGDAASGSGESASDQERENQALEDTADDASIEPDAPASTEVATQVVAPAKPAGRAVAWLALLIALCGAGGAGYFGWLFLQERDASRSIADVGELNQKQIKQFQSSLDALDKQLSNERQSRSAESKALRQKLSAANTLIEGQSRRLLSLTATTTDDWRLAEIEYLLRLANQRILTSKDGRTALNLLQAADEILVELGDPRLYEVRKAIANDRAALAVVGQVDLDGIFLQLSGIGAQVDKLPLLSVPSFAARSNELGGQQTQSMDEGSAATESAEAGEAKPLSALAKFTETLSEVASSTWAELKSLVVIQQRDTTVKPLLPPEQQYYLRSNLRLLLNQAQIALLDGKQVAYRESLRSAVSLMHDHFPMQEAANQQMAADLSTLSELVIAADYPDVSASLLAIKAFIAEQHRLGGKDAAKPAVKASEGAA